MSLPVVAPRTEEVELGAGQTVTVRSLTRAEALAIGQFRTDDAPNVEQVAAFEAYLIAKGMDVTVEEATAWCARTDSSVVDALTTAIARVSGLAKDGQTDPKPSTSETSSTADSTPSTSS